MGVQGVSLQKKNMSSTGDDWRLRTACHRLIGLPVSSTSALRWLSWWDPQQIRHTRQRSNSWVQYVQKSRSWKRRESPFLLHVRLARAGRGYLPLNLNLILLPFNRRHGRRGFWTRTKYQRIMDQPDCCGSHLNEGPAFCLPSLYPSQIILTENKGNQR